MIESVELERAACQPEDDPAPLRGQADAGQGDATLPHEEVHGVEPGRKRHQELVVLATLRSKLLRRDTQRRILEIVAARAGVDLGPAACWTLGQIDRSPDSNPRDLARTYSVDPARLLAAFGELEARGMIEKSGADPGTPPRYAPTAAGRDALRRLDDARRERVAELLADWSPDQHRQVAELLRRYASDVPDEAPAAKTSAS